jgi:non-heme chloroperoxidase
MPEAVELNHRVVGDGRPVVFIHGWGMALEAWDRQVMALADEYTCVPLDLRGHGHSPKPFHGYGYDDHVADVRALIARLGLQDVTLVGWSMGGGVAARVAAQDPAVSQLVLVGAPPKYMQSDDFPQGRAYELCMEHHRNVLTAREDTMWDTVVATCKIPQSDAVNRWLYGLSVHGAVWGVLRCYEGVMEADVRPDLLSLRMPILQLHCVHDLFIDISAARWLDEAVPHSVLIEFPDSGHAPHIEETDTFNRHLRAFLDAA